MCWLSNGRHSLASDATTPHDVSAQDAWYPEDRRNASIVRQLVTKDFKLKYRRSILGVAWSVLNPLLMMVVLSIVFSNMIRTTDPSITNFPLYLILGNTCFGFMTDATSQGMNSIVGAAPLLKKVKISRWVFPVQKVLFAGLNYIFSMIAVAIVMVYYQWEPSANILFFPLLLLYLGVFCVGLSMLLSAAAVFFRDVIHLWGVVLTAWTYATPLFYSETILPEWLLNLEVFNPMYLMVKYVRQIFLWRMTPSLELNLQCAACAVIMLIIGLLVFRRTEHRFILYI